jgi:hypothetical protein
VMGKPAITHYLKNQGGLEKKIYIRSHLNKN